MQEHTKAHGMGQRKNKLYMYILAIGNYEKQNLLYGNRRQESTQKAKRRAIIHTRDFIYEYVKLCVCEVMLDGWQPHRLSSRAAETPRPKKHVGYPSCPYLLAVNGFQWLCLPLQAHILVSYTHTLTLLANDCAALSAKILAHLISSFHLLRSNFKFERTTRRSFLPS